MFNNNSNNGGGWHMFSIDPKFREGTPENSAYTEQRRSNITNNAQQFQPQYNTQPQMQQQNPQMMYQNQQMPNNGYGNIPCIDASMASPDMLQSIQINNMMSNAFHINPIPSVDPYLLIQQEEYNRRQQELIARQQMYANQYNQNYYQNRQMMYNNQMYQNGQAQYYQTPDTRAQQAPVENNQQSVAQQQGGEMNTVNVDELISRSVDNLVNSEEFARTVPRGNIVVEENAQSANITSSPFVDNSAENADEEKEIENIKQKGYSNMTTEEHAKYWKKPIWGFNDVLKNMGYDEKTYKVDRSSTVKNKSINPYYDWKNSPAGQAAERESDNTGLKRLTNVINGLKSLGNKPVEDPNRVPELVYASMMNYAPNSAYQNSLYQFPLGYGDPRYQMSSAQAQQFQPQYNTQPQMQQGYYQQQNPQMMYQNQQANGNGVVNPYIEWQKAKMAREYEQQFYQQQMANQQNPAMQGGYVPNVEAAAAKYGIPASPYRPFM